MQQNQRYKQLNVNWKKKTCHPKSYFTYYMMFLKNQYEKQAKNMEK